mgnify:CR=1 FL=1
MGINPETTTSPRRDDDDRTNHHNRPERPDPDAQAPHESGAEYHAGGDQSSHDARRAHE